MVLKSKTTALNNFIPEIYEKEDLRKSLHLSPFGFGETERETLRIRHTAQSRQRDKIKKTRWQGDEPVPVQAVRISGSLAECD